MILLLHLTLIAVASPYRYLVPANVPGEVNRSISFVNSEFDVARHEVKLDEVPFHVLITYNSLYCSGVLIASTLVITTASCFHRLNKDESCFVKLGVHDIRDHGQTIQSVEIKTHEFFQRTSALDNDIAMVVLETSVDFSPHVKKAMLVEPEIALRAKTIIEVSGWGSPIKQGHTNKLVWSQMVIMNIDECRKVHGSLITYSNFCAQYTRERRHSDNGGPAIFKDLLVGLLSYGGNRPKEPYVAIFTNVSYFNRWISSKANEFLFKYCLEDSEYYDEDVGSKEKELAK